MLRYRSDREGEGMTFDPNIATARYIDSLGPAALQKAHDYTVGKEWMLLWSLFVSAAVTWLFVRSGIAGSAFWEARRAAREPARICDCSRLFHRLCDPDTPMGHLRRLVS